MSNVLVAIPNTGNILAALAEWTWRFDKMGHTIDRMLSEMRPIEANRRFIRKVFLDGDYDYLIQIDSDILPPDNLLTLIDRDKDIISAGVKSIKEMGIVPMALREISPNNYVPITEKGLFECDAVGGGCTCIKREVLEKIDYSYMSDTVKAEDFDFCRRAKAAGFEVWYDSTVVVKHHTIVPL